jgi:hypothetical protein
MYNSVTIEDWNIDFPASTARFSIEDDKENAQVVVDVTLRFRDAECTIHNATDCWYVHDDRSSVVRTTINKSEKDNINAILTQEYVKFLAVD